MRKSYGMERLAAFVSEHINDDTTRLIMNRAKWPEIDMDLAVNCIESRRKLKGKVQEWCDDPRLVFPRKLSAEQCSSSATGTYKAELAERIHLTMTDVTPKSEIQNNESPKDWIIEDSIVGFRLADLTGGLGVDSWFFSQKASQVLYNEMQTPLCDAARHNFRALGVENILISNRAVGTVKESGLVSPEELLGEFQPDIIYMDPARRGEGGRKVFLIEDCTPDVLTLKDELFAQCSNFLIKLSPMADITMVCDRLGICCREVHIVSSDGECKELLLWLDKDWSEGYSITAVELPSGYPERSAAILTFNPADEKSRLTSLCSEIGEFLFEPGKSLTKAGAFNTTGTHFGIGKLGRSTHHYVTSDMEKAELLKDYGKIFKVISWQPLDKRSIKEIGKTYPRAEVTARNIPLTSEALRKKLGCASGGDVHIFGLKSDVQGNLLLVCQRT